MDKRICLSLFAACLFSLSTATRSNADELVPAFAWGNVAIGGGGFVSAIIADPLERGLFYARTDVGGAYRWDNAAERWIPITDWLSHTERTLLGIKAIAVDPQTPGKVYMVAGTSYWNDGRSAFMRSSDRGKPGTWEVFYTWDPQGEKGGAVSNFDVNGNGMGRGNGEALAVDPNDPNIMFYGSQRHGLFRSTNNGMSWSKVPGFTAAAGHDTTWNGCGFSFVAFAPGSSETLYAGFLRAGDNVFRSTDAGVTWSVIPNRPRPATSGGYVPPLMPQRIVIAQDNSALYITFGDGAGPHSMLWEEDGRNVRDWFNRGAVLKLDIASGVWTDVSPQDFIDPPCSGQNCPNNNADSTYIATYGGITMNPNNPLEIVVSTLGYNGPQFWRAPGSTNTWHEQWGSNIFYTSDGGETWVPTFRYYWMQGGQFPPIETMNENGIGWMFNSSIHWAGSVMFDPFDSKRMWVTSGNGVFKTENMGENTVEQPNPWDEPSVIQRTTWRVMSHGIEETVPIDVVSIPGGPLVSVILDYDGFRHDDIAQFPSSRHRVEIRGQRASLGHNIALAWAPKAGRLVKVTDERRYNAGTHENPSWAPIWPVQFSADSGRTWTVTSDQNNAIPNLANLPGAEGVSISTDGQVVLWTPGSAWDHVNNVTVLHPVQRLVNGIWNTVSGIDGAYTAGDPENADIFYAYSRWSGKFFRSGDKGATFEEVSEPGSSAFKKFRAAPGQDGDIWLPLTENGLLRSTDGGESWTSVAAVSYCEAVGFGKAEEGKEFPTVFIFGTVNGRTGVFMSTDEGESWFRANDDRHQYGGLANGEFVVGDMNVFGRVYMSTAGRGIVYGEFTGMTVSARPDRTNRPGAAAGAVRVRGATISINAANNVTHDIRVFDLRGRQIYKNTVSGSATLAMNRVLPRGNYVVQARRDGKVVFRSRFFVVRQ
jgi:hypothetical protein